MGDDTKKEKKNSTAKTEVSGNVDDGSDHDNGGSIFYHDRTMKFTRVFLMGIETQILVFLFLLHAVMDLGFNNTLASVLVVALVNLTIDKVRTHFGKDNLSKKTMLHERFFL